jgi:dipeptidyl-peptidase 4
MNIGKSLRKLFILIGIVFSLVTYGQQKSPCLTLEDIYTSHTYSQKYYGPVRWMKDNKGYSTLETNKELGGTDIVRYDAQSGQRTVLVSAKQLTPSLQSKPLNIDNYNWSDDDSKLLIFTNTKKVWRYNTRGDYWVLNLKTGSLQQLGKSVESSTMMFAKFSPDATRVGYVSKLNIYVESLATNQVQQITHDGGDNIVNGTFDWVYEEELDCRDGFRWSPDGKNIAYWQSDTKGIGTFYLINNVDSNYSLPVPLPYPKVGTPLSAVKVGVVDANGGTTRWFNIPGKSDEHYLARMDFIPSSNDLMIQQLNRQQNNNMVWIGNIESMTVKNILTETDKAFLDVHDDTRWLENGKYFTWTSERDGWNHLYKISRDGKELKLITKGDFDVIQINCIDSKNGYVYFIASPQNYTQRYLFRSRLDGTGKVEQVTPAAMAGQSSYQMSDDGKWAIQTFQNVRTPLMFSLVSLPHHKEQRLLEDNHLLKQNYDKLGLNEKAFFKVDIGDLALDAWMIKPAGFDSAKKYPLLFYVYGEPAGSTVQDVWEGSDLWHQYMAQHGFIVISIDNRGTKTPRGKEWRNAIYRQIGILASADQRKAALKIFDMFPFIDSSRVGIWGWSGGGQMTLNCMFRYPGIYKTGLAVSFVSDQKLYDATYQERYMDLLVDNAKGYHDGSPINFAKYLQGKLMIIHGTADDNVHYQSFELLVNELIKTNKLFYMMSYPMRSHSIDERENTTLHLRRTMEKFWKDNL